ncbi:MAG: beta strand repeat-containing protein, partial [Pseudohongiellaceae bacterium]
MLSSDAARHRSNTNGRAPALSTTVTLMAPMLSAFRGAGATLGVWLLVGFLGFGFLQEAQAQQPPSDTPVVDLLPTSDTRNANTNLTNMGTDDDKITSNNMPSFRVSDIVGGASVGISGTRAGVPGSIIFSTVPVPLGQTSHDFNLTQTLNDGVWTITAGHTEPGKRTTLSAGLTVTIDTVAPRVTVVSPNTDPARSKIFTATDNDDTTTVMKYRGQVDANCPNSPPDGSTADYIEGEGFTLNEDSANGGYACFYSTDLAGNSAWAASNRIGGIDSTDPTITLSGAAAISHAEATTITIVASESITTLAVANITVAPGSAGTISAVTAVGAAGTDYTATFTASSDSVVVTLSVGTNAVTDAVGNGNAASNSLEINITPTTISEPVLSVTGGSAVAEGQGAAFTINADGRPGSELTVAVTAANATGTFLATGAPTSVTLPNDGSTWTVTVPTQDSTGGDGAVATDGAITLTLDSGSTGTGYSVSTTAGADIGIVTVRDLPLVTIGFAGQASGTTTCPASAASNKGGICEGDGIIFTLTASPMPAANMDVRLGRLEAGLLSSDDGPLNYGLTTPHNGYVDDPNERDPSTLTIVGNMASVSYTVATNNLYGAQMPGALYNEIVCLVDGPSGSTSYYCLADGTGDYKFNVRDRGQFETNPAAGNSNCGTRTAGADNNEDSECLVDIHPVAAPELSVTAAVTVDEGSDAVFTITATSAPNNYNTARDALIGLPIGITVDETGSSLANAAPTMVTLGAGATTVEVTLMIQEGDALGTGSVSLAIDSGTGYAVSSTAGAITIAVVEAGDPIISITDAGEVAEGNEATFTLSANKAAPADLVITLAAANSTGTFLPTTGVPTTVTMAMNNNSVELTVSTMATLGTGTGGTIADGIISVTLATGTGYTLAASMTVATVTVKDIPVITVDYASLSNGGKVCPATGEAGVCEGDAIVFTLTADAAPATDLDVRIGRLSAGASNCCDYGITSPHNYVGGDEDDGHRTVTIAGGQNDGTHTIDTNNGYGTNGDGGYFIEIVCLVDGDQTTCLSDGTINTYTFATLTKGGSTASNTGDDYTGRCDTAAGGDGDDSSECLAHIHPVTAPAMSIEAGSTGVTGGNPVTFTITGTTEPNHYTADRTALAALPVAITVKQGSTALTGAPATVDMPVGATTADVMITTGADVGTLEVTITDTDGYSVGTPATASVAVTAPSANASATPTVALDDDSNSGSTDDNITNNGTPTFNLTGLVDGASVVVLAVSPDGSLHLRRTITVSGVTIADLLFNDDEDDSEFCELSGDSGATFSTEETCAFTNASPSNGDWTITAIQTETGGKNASEAATLTVTLDTVAPSITLSAGTSTLAAGSSTVVTATFSEAPTGMPPGIFTFDFDGGVRLGQSISVGGSDTVFTLV